MEKLLLVCVLYVGIVHSISIPHSASDNAESLAKSWTLMDWTTSSAPAAQSGLAGKEARIQEETKGELTSMSRCRAACVAKHSNPSPTTTPASSKIEEATTLIMDAISAEDKARNDYEKLLPKMLRLKRSTPSDATALRSAEIAKCFKSCDSRDSEKIPSHVVTDNLMLRDSTKTLGSAGSTATDDSDSGPFQPQLVSLIHQNAEIVIAEIRWDDGNHKPGRDYQVSWEIIGGGLKGYLITGSTTVTLSLWPNSRYKITVAASQAMNKLNSVETRPLVVDTTVVSFPSNQPSSILTAGPDADEDELEDETVDDEYEEDYFPEDKSIGKILGLCLLSAVFLLLIVSLVTFLVMKVKQCCSRHSNGYLIGPALLEGNYSNETVYTPSVAIISQKIGFPLRGSASSFSSTYRNVLNNTNVYKTLSVATHHEWPEKQYDECWDPSV